jgi:hypothetical protein
MEVANGGGALMVAGNGYTQELVHLVHKDLVEEVFIEEDIL